MKIELQKSVSNLRKTVLTTITILVTLGIVFKISTAVIEYQRYREAYGREYNFLINKGYTPAEAKADLREIEEIAKETGHKAF